MLLTASERKEKKVYHIPRVNLKFIAFPVKVCFHRLHRFLAPPVTQIIILASYPKRRPTNGVVNFLNVL